MLCVQDDYNLKSLPGASLSKQAGTWHIEWYNHPNSDPHAPGSKCLECSLHRISMNNWCKTCPILIATNEFFSHTTGHNYKLKKFSASWRSSNVVYIITCRRCCLQCVGETSQPLHARVNGHQFIITQQRTDVSPVAEHFNSGVHSELDMTVMVIELSSNRVPCLQKIKKGG